MSLTINTHYNPCFWTALWNTEYFQSFIENNKYNTDCRKQSIFSLKIKGNKIIQTTIENVFFEKYTGIASLKNDEIIKYCIKYKPEEVSNFQKTDDTESEVLFWDFENFFTIFEKEFGYDTLMNLIKTKDIKDISDKTNLGSFILSHWYRNPQNLNPLFREKEKNGRPKFEVFLEMKNNIFGNPENLKNKVIRIISKEWILLESKRPIPLGDNSIFEYSNKLYVVVSPYLVLMITNKQVEIDCIFKRSILGYFHYRKIVKQILLNSYNEIISGNKDALDKIMKKTYYKSHFDNIKNKDHIYYR